MGVLSWAASMGRVSGNEMYIQFLQGTRPTGHGRYFQEILAYNDRQLEADHQFIQWIFPLPDPSPVNPNAPLIEIKSLSANAVAHEKMCLSYQKMCQFWGLGDQLDLEKLKSLNGHNGLRFSRALQSLVYHDHQALAKELLDKVLANLQVLRPKMHSSGVTLWQHLYEESIRKLDEARR
eukprot:gene25091-30305_t